MSGDEALQIFEQVADHVKDGRRDDAMGLMMDVFASQATEIKRLENQLQRLKKRLFGRRSERVLDEQLRLFEEQQPKATAEEKSEKGPPLSDDEEVLVKEHRRKKRDRTPIDVSGLPHEVIEVSTPECRCKCGKELKKIGIEETKVIERIPASCKVVVYRRAKMACSCCKQSGVLTAPPPEKPVPGSMLGYSLLVDLVLNKFALHMPLNRLRRLYSKEGLEVSCKTLSEWTGRSADILKPLANEIMARALVARVLNTDDTIVTVLDRDAPGGSKKGRLWVYIGDRKWIAFDFTSNWQSDRPQELLRRRARGPTQCDGYRGYYAVFDDRELELVEVGCWSHARRKLADVLPKDKRTAEPLRLLKQLFRLEELATAKNLTPEQRLELRQSRSKPIHDRLHVCFTEQLAKLAPKDDLAAAIRYATERWEALSVYLTDGNLEMTNNIAERHLRRIAVGRANWMFAGSDAGGAWAAVLYTVIATAETAGVDVRNYLCDVMPQLVRGDYRDIADLLPDAWAHRQIEKPDTQAA